MNRFAVLIAAVILVASSQLQYATASEPLMTCSLSTPAGAPSGVQFAVVAGKDISQMAGVLILTDSQGRSARFSMPVAYYCKDRFNLMFNGRTQKDYFDIAVFGGGGAFLHFRGAHPMGESVQCRFTRLYDFLPAKGC